MKTEKWIKGFIDIIVLIRIQQLISVKHMSVPSKAGLEWSSQFIKSSNSSFLTEARIHEH